MKNVKFVSLFLAILFIGNNFLVFAQEQNEIRPAQCLRFRVYNASKDIFEDYTSNIIQFGYGFNRDGFLMNIYFNTVVLNGTNHFWVLSDYTRLPNGYINYKSLGFGYYNDNTGNGDVKNFIGIGATIYRAPNGMTSVMIKEGSQVFVECHFVDNY
jgi:hypothetical protein